jgi:hypothetical protein
MSEPLYTCPICRQQGFTARGLKTHQGGKTCRRRAAQADAGTHWKCAACTLANCFSEGSKPSKCIAGHIIAPSWQPATPEEYAAAQTA